MKPIVGISMGDPAGVGPEVIVKAFSNHPQPKNYRPVIVGDISILKRTAEENSFDLNLIAFKDFNDLPDDHSAIAVFDAIPFDHRHFKYGQISKQCGDFSYKVVVKSVELCQNKLIDALVTGPISKESWHLAGHNFDGHTGLLAKLTNSKDYRMMFASEKLNVLLVTTHLPLIEACSKIKPSKVYETIQMGYHHIKQMGKVSPRIAVCGLNPHAGENGIFGREDLNCILPAIQQAQKEGIEVSGPHPADTIFIAAIQGKYDLIIAQYHDQGLIPVKLNSFETSVNITLGLPIIRTSVDHGTAFDISGKGIANHENILHAIDYAVQLCCQSRHSEY